MSATLYVVATPIGNLEDITLRALRVLREVALIAAEDTRRTAHLLARHGITTPTTSLHEHNEDRKAPAILARLLGGEAVALVSDAGTPTVSDPGARLVRLAIDAGIRIEAIPGASAVLTALSASGLTGDGFAFLGFPPTKAKARNAWFARLASLSGPVVFFESPHRISSTLTDLQAAIGDQNVLVARELTKQHEELVRGPISTVLGRVSEPRGEYTVVVDIGQKPDSIIIDVDQATDSRRKALASVAKLHGLTANELYAAIQKLKKSGDRPT